MWCEISRRSCRDQSYSCIRSFRTGIRHVSERRRSRQQTRQRHTVCSEQHYPEVQNRYIYDHVLSVVLRRNEHKDVVGVLEHRVCGVDRHKLRNQDPHVVCDVGDTRVQPECCVQGLELDEIQGHCCFTSQKVACRVVHKHQESGDRHHVFRHASDARHQRHVVGFLTRRDIPWCIVCTRTPFCTVTSSRVPCAATFRVCHDSGPTTPTVHRTQ
jgi:hypothetical protein